MDTTRTTDTPMDMSQFKGAFLEEAVEHLADMESLLVRLDLARPSRDELNAIFRAAHSIKGGSGMFGMSDTTVVTHELESMLDRVRKGELALSSAMVDVLLEASDLLRVQLAYYGATGPAPSVAPEDMCARIRASIVAGGCEGPVAAAPEPAGPDKRRVDLTFPVSGLDKETIRELVSQLGELGAVEADLEAEPELHTDGTPMRTIHLTTDSPDELVLTLFDFVMDARQVRLTAAAAAAPAPNDAKQGYGFFAELPPKSSGAPEAPKPVEPAKSASATAAPARAAASIDSSIRVSVEKVDQLINQVGELVITQAMLAESMGGIDSARHQKLLAGMADLERNTRDLQQSVMSIRMMPIAFVFNRFPRMARDLAAKLGKEVKLVTEGENTELDKGLIEMISDPLTHLMRNSIDHGIESPETRVARGKPRVGTIVLRAAHQGGNIVIEVIDDGAGLDRTRIIAKARERGMAADDGMADRDVWNLIFEPGFSTAATVTDVSGRGVGMDVVRRNIASLSGSVEIDSTVGQGTRMTVRLPLTLAIMDGMSVAAGNETYILPLASIVESLQVAAGTIRSVAGQGLVIHVRGEFLPVVSLAGLFSQGGPEDTSRDRTVVVVEADESKTALLVEELLGQHQVVVKSLDANYRKVRGISGATIMGDGRVALIVDVATLARMRAAPRMEAALATEPAIA